MLESERLVALAMTTTTLMATRMVTTKIVLMMMALRRKSVLEDLFTAPRQSRIAPI